MTATAVNLAGTGHPALPAPGRAVSRLARRQIRFGALTVVAVTAGMTALVAATYAQVVADPAAARGLQTLAANPAIRTLFGAPVGLDTAGGFTVWRVGTVTAVLLGAWTILATTRITRGEEDSGRWAVLLAGRISLPGATLRHLSTVMIVPVASGAAITGVLGAAGTPTTGALNHGAGTAALGLFFAATAALTAQIFPTRTPATGTAVAVLGASLLARMIGDGVDTLSWLHWLSPFGLLTLSGPYVDNRFPPLLLLLAATAVLVVATHATATRRDLGSGLIAPTSGRPARLRLLGSVEAFAVRRALRPLAGWALGIGAYYLLIGLTAVSVTGFLATNPQFAGRAAAAGFAGLGSIAGFTATLFAILAIPVGAFTAVRLQGYVDAETSRRVTMLAAQPVSRTRLIGADVLVTAAAAGVLLSVAALATWAGTAATGGHLAITAALAGAWNTLPVVLLSLGAAVLAIGWAPRATGVLGALPATGGFLLLVIADSIAAPHWIRELSPFAHLAAVPLAHVEWTSWTAMVAAAATLAAAGTAGYRRRDLRT